MSFFKKCRRGEGIVDDSSGGSSDEDGISSNEELYMELFSKIGRDFIHKEDVYRIFEELLDIIGIDDYEIDRSEGSALQRAEEYKHFLKTNQSGANYYPDLLDPEED